MKLNWNFLGGGGFKTKKPSVEGVWIFSGTAHSAGSINFADYQRQENSLIQREQNINSVHHRFGTQKKTL